MTDQTIDKKLLLEQFQFFPEQGQEVSFSSSSNSKIPVVTESDSPNITSPSNSVSISCQVQDVFLPDYYDGHLGVYGRSVTLRCQSLFISDTKTDCGSLLKVSELKAFENEDRTIDETSRIESEAIITVLEDSCD